MQACAACLVRLLALHAQLCSFDCYSLSSVHFFIQLHYPFLFSRHLTISFSFHQCELTTRQSVKFVAVRSRHALSCQTRRQCRWRNQMVMFIGSASAGSHQAGAPDGSLRRMSKLSFTVQWPRLCSDETHPKAIASRSKQMMAAKHQLPIVVSRRTTKQMHR